MGYGALGSEAGALLVLPGSPLSARRLPVGDCLWSHTGRWRSVPGPRSGPVAGSQTGEELESEKKEKGYLLLHGYSNRGIEGEEEEEEEEEEGPRAHRQILGSQAVTGNSNTRPVQIERHKNTALPCKKRRKGLCSTALYSVILFGGGRKARSG